MDAQMDAQMDAHIRGFKWPIEGVYSQLKEAKQPFSALSDPLFPKRCNMKAQ